MIRIVLDIFVIMKSIGEKNPIDVVKAIHNCDLSVASKKELDKFF